VDDSKSQAIQSGAARWQSSNRTSGSRADHHAYSRSNTRTFAAPWSAGWAVKVKQPD